MRTAAIALLLLVTCATCAHAPATVKSLPGPVCQGADFPADAPCLEAGQPTPFAGLLLAPDVARAHLAKEQAAVAAEDSLRKSLIVDIGIAVALALLAGAGGYELGHALK